MKNVDVKVEGKKLTITVDLDKNYGDSKSGKTLIIASTEGNVRINPDDPQVFLGLNLFRKKP